MKFTLALFAAASAELTGQPSPANSFATQRENLREHVNFTLDKWYGDCPDVAKWDLKLNDMVNRLDKAFNKCGAEWEGGRKRRQADEEEGLEERLSKKDVLKATQQIRSVTKRITGRNLGGCTRNRMLARAERIVGKMNDAKKNGEC